MKKERFFSFLFFLLLFSVLVYVSSLAFKLLPSLIKKFKRNELPPTIRVEVLNGTVEDKLAKRVAILLRKRGFDVVFIGNAGSQDFEETIAVERIAEDSKYAKYLAKKIGCRHIIKKIDPNRYLEVTLILGKDCKKIFPELRE